ncbi:hypothetical protein GCM10009792_01000 [Microcella alkalica]|uniref:Uncharacterized protein (DUF2461 family) n=1 Tax=Microcella alkalica TaxID=355930 RepID=A0A839E7V2_9MICO|nr:uncharacterized protein (DUF2461 family) [Microcella alkalica]
MSAVHADGTYYLQVSQHGLLLAGGQYQPSREQLARFREICDDNRLVGDLEATLEEAAERGFAIMTTDALATPRAASEPTTRRSPCSGSSVWPSPPTTNPPTG